MKILFVTGGGIGNIIQATPTIKALAIEGHKVDLRLHCNSGADIREVFNIPSVRQVFIDKEPKGNYDCEMRGLFIPSSLHGAKKTVKCKISYAQHIPESEVYYSLAKQIGIKAPMGDCEINVGQNGPIPEHKHTVAIYPGSKYNWAMKRWDKYDELAKKFKHVAVVGTDKDINTHGNPTWITRSWKWPKHVRFAKDPQLVNVAHFISKCDMFIGNDGGLAHVAAATGIPTFVLFGPSSDVKNKPKAHKAHVVAINLPCRPCQFKKKNGKSIFDGNIGNCYLNMKCMNDMSVDFVLKQMRAQM